MYLLTVIFLIVLSTPAISSESGHMSGITEAHNSIRLRLGIEELKWSDELAQYAREWADFLANENQCVLRHRPQTGEYGQQYGENVYWASSIQFSNGENEIQQIDAGKVVNSWAAESIDYDHKKNTCRDGKTCGHYTQVIWSTTTELGCGMSLCKDKSQVWVCNYYPPGNINGQVPY